MKILCISKDLAIADLLMRLKREGHAVKVFISDKKERVNYEGMLEKVDDWKRELPWVGKDGFILFDNVGFGQLQDELRKDGYWVVGGSVLGDKLEHDRQYGQKIFSMCGIEVVPSINFSNAKKAIEFVKKHKGPWVLKQNGHVDKAFNYVGQMENNEDVLEILKNYCRNNRRECSSLDLQKKVEGVEIGVGRYFNGNDWVGPLEMNMEHKNLFNDNLGPKTFEMGTLTWYENNENNKIFQQTLAKLKGYLKNINFHGDVDINCIIDGNEIYPLEVTARFGFPAIHLQSALQISPWGEFLMAIAKGESYDMKYKKGFGVVVLVATPPFPYEVRSRKYYPVGESILFKSKLTEEEKEHIHFEEVSYNARKKNYYISGKNGFALHVSGVGTTVEEAREKAYKLIGKIVIPKMFYRTDIGLKFLNEDREKLEKWGWI